MIRISKQVIDQARLHLDRRETDQLRALLEDVAEGGLKHILLGTAAMMDGALEVAQKHFLTVLEENPSEPTARANLSVICTRQGRAALSHHKPEAAQEAFTSALEYNEGNLDALLGLAEACQELCAFEDAATLYRTSLPALEHPADVLVRLGACLLELRDGEAAKDCFRDALRQDSSVLANVEGAYKTSSFGQIWLNRQAFVEELTS